MQSEQQDEELLERAVFGKQVESFLASDVGRYLQARANSVYNAAVEDFKRVDPADVNKVRQIQADMWKAEAFTGWLGQAVQEGLTALGIIEGRDDDTPV